MKYIYTLICAGSLALTVAGCNGGDKASGETAPAIDAAATVPSDQYRELSPAQADAASFVGSASVDLPSSAQLQPGNVIAVKGKAVKLVSIESGAGSGMTRYGFTPARLNDLFKKLTLNGGSSVTAATPGGEPIDSKTIVK